MKTTLTFFLWMLCITSVFAQTEATIRLLEQAEVDAIMAKDTMTLNKIWATDFMVNNPFNYILEGKDKVIDLVLHGRINYSVFEREIEQIMVKEGFVVSMGNETVVPVATGQTIKRRYTNIYSLQNGEWRISARHANIICNE